MNKNIFLILSLPLLINHCYAQDNSKEVTFKVYANAMLFQPEPYLFNNGSLSTTYQLNFNPVHFSPSISIFQKNKYQELEFSRLAISKNKYQVYLDERFIEVENREIIEGGNTVSFDVALRYEYGLLLTGNKSNNLKTLIGLSVSPYFQRTKFNPAIANSFPRYHSSVGFDFSIIPRIQYFLNERIFFDLNLPIAVSRLGYQFQRIENPGIPLPQQRNSGYDFQFFHGDPVIRFGTGIKL